MTSATHLDDLLTRLRAERDALAPGDEAARQRIDELVVDLQARDSADEGLAGQLTDTVVGFEASHPRLAAVINDFLEKLAKMGI